MGPRTDEDTISLLRRLAALRRNTVQFVQWGSHFWLPARFRAAREPKPGGGPEGQPQTEQYCA
jgi:hypothetical protein